MLTYTIVGTITQDVLPNGELTFGGTTFYAGKLLQELKHHCIIHSACPDGFSLPFPGLIQQPAATLAVFQNIYTDTGRVQYLLSKPAMTKIPSTVLGDIIHIAPLLDDVDISSCDNFPQDSLIITTPQGWFRSVDARGAVRLNPYDFDYSQLRFADVVILSDEDLLFDDNLISYISGVLPLVIVTRGSAGAQLCGTTHDSMLIETAPVANPVQLTGAGDIFAASFAVKLRESASLLDAINFANHTAGKFISRGINL